MRLKALLAVLPLLAAGCVTGSQPIPAEWMSVPTAARIGSLILHTNGTVTPTVEPLPPRLSDGPIRVMGASILNGDKVLAENLGAIDSVDLSEARGEVAFSAKHENGFDIGLVNIQGGPVHWMPSDPADELAVQWAPRGNKISYIIHANGGDVVRTLHIPTSAQLAVPFPNATIHALSWDWQAEHYAVAYSTPDSSDRVEMVEYDGDDRHTVIEPAQKLDVEIAPFAPGAIVLRPKDVRYDEKLPLVVWLADDFSWNDARAALLSNARTAVVVTTKPPDAELWRVAKSTAWLNPSRVFVVGASTDRPNAIAITGDATMAGKYERRGNIVAVPPAVVQSFAAGYIAAQLKRNPPTNGSSR